MMANRSLNHNDEYVSLLKYLRQTLKQDYGDVIRLGFASNIPVELSKVAMEPTRKYPVRSVVGAAGVYANGMLGVVSNDISEESLTHVVVSAFHECRHAVILQAMNDKELSAEIPDIEYMSVTHLACLYNNKYNISNWKRLITEIDAERFGVQQADVFLSDYYGYDKASRMLLKYVNGRISGNSYVIPRDDNVHYPYTNLEDVYADFDVYQEESKHFPREYWNLKKGSPSDIKTDISAKFFDEDVSKRAQYAFIHCKDGYVQDKIMAAIVLNKKPKCRNYHVALAGYDLTLDTSFGVLCDNWYDTGEQFEPPVEKKVVPEGVRKIQEQEAYWNKVLAKPDFSQNRNLRELDKSGQSDDFEFQ